MNRFEENNQELLSLVGQWSLKLQTLSEEILSTRRNKQYRTIKQIVGHMVDSASNNTHRIIHLQYQETPYPFPDYANLGCNDKWIAIQSYQTENWTDLVQLWTSTNKHIIHVIRHVNPQKLDQEWISALGENISLREMILDYLSHFKLHLAEIDELIEQQ